MVALDPGGLIDSKIMNQGVPKAWTFMMKWVLSPLQPLLKFLIPTLRSVTTAGIDLIEISIGEQATKGGYYTMMNSDASSPESKDEGKQRKLWSKSLEWAGITQDKTALKTAFS